MMHFFLFLIILSGCSQDKPKLPGKREAVLEESSSFLSPLKSFSSQGLKTESFLKTHFEYAISPRSLRGLTSPSFVTKDNLYIIDGKNVIRCFDKKGKVIWEKTLSEEENLSGGICGKDNTVYISLFNGDFYALHAKTGKTLWHKKLDTIIRSQPCVGDHAIFLFTEYLTAFDKKNGEILWKMPLPLERNTLTSHLAPVLENGVVFALTRDLQAYQSLNGQMLWEQKIDDDLTPHVKALPVVDHNAVFVLSYKGNLLKINQQDGTLIWKQNIKASSQPFLWNNLIFVIHDDNMLFCFDKETGKGSWKQELNNETRWLGAFMHKGKLIALSEVGDILCLDPLKGKKIKQESLNMMFSLLPIVWNDKLVFVSDEGQVLVRS